MAGGDNATVHVPGFLVMKEKAIVNTIHLQNRPFSKGLFETRNPACSGDRGTKTPVNDRDRR
jgi:hypothetical protein